MEHSKSPIHISVIVLGLFFFIMMLNVLTVTKTSVQDIAFTTMAWTEYISLFVLGFYIQKRNGFVSSTAPFTIGIMLFAFSYIITYILGEEMFNSSEALSNILLVLVFVLGMAQIKWNTDHMKVFGLLATACMFIFFLQWMHQDFPASLFQSSIRNPNIFGALIAILLYFPLVSFSSSNAWQKTLLSAGLVVGLFLVVVSSARAALLIIFIAVGARVVSYISSKIFNLLFYIVMLINLGFAFIYVWLYKSQLLMGINYWFLDHFGQQIFSGRQYIWDKAISYALEKPVLGHFVGIVPDDFITDAHYVHAHNQYLQILLESGLVGLGCFVLMLFAIWKVYQKSLNSSLVVWSACFYLGILFYQSLEVSLFDNMQAVGLFQWLIIAIGLGACVKEVKQ